MQIKILIEGFWELIPIRLGHNMVNYILNFYINIKIKNQLRIRGALVNKINKLKEIISQINQNWIWANLKYNPPIIINKQFFN